MWSDAGAAISSLAPTLASRAIAFDEPVALSAIPTAYRRRTFPGRSAARSPCGVLRCRPGIVPGSEFGVSRFWRGHDVERSRISGAPLRIAREDGRKRPCELRAAPRPGKA